MENKILEILDGEKTLSIVEVDKQLGIKNLEETNKIIDKMINDLVLVKTKKNKITKTENTNYLKGKIQTTKGGNGFVIIEGRKDVFIKDIKGAINGDLVLISLLTEDRGKIEKIKRMKTEKVGETVNKNGKTYVKIDDKKFNYIVELKEHYVDGMKVAVKLFDTIDKKTMSGHVLEVLGHKDDPGIDLLSITRDYGIEKEFPKKVLEEVKKIPSEISEKDINDIIKKGGKDLREEIIFTIDGDDTKDIDDALSIKMLPNYNYEVGVHIANVSHYVKPNSSLFKNATTRGTSVYIPGSSIPMLPRELSNGICSLNPNVDRLALSFIMEIDKQGNVVDFKIHESIINSKIQMTYKKVNKILEDNEISSGYEDYVTELKMLNRVANIIRRKRIKGGSIDFDMDENKVILDELGNPVDVVLRERGQGEKLIEDFMVLTGEQSSIFLDKNENVKHVYRNHDEPNAEKLEKFISYINSLGYKKMTTCISELNPKEIQTLLNNLKDTKEYDILKRELLKCMAKAIYASNNSGHFALGLKTYCQTTSPIRRAGDLINHVLIKENIYSNQSPKWNTELPELASQASQTERNATECEREAVKMKTAEYMKNHIGEEFKGKIVSLTKYGMYVELPNLIEGLVSIESMIDDNYEFDAAKFIYMGRTSKRVYRLGDTVTIRVTDASKENKTIDFEIVGNENLKVKKRGKFER